MHRPKYEEIDRLNKLLIDKNNRPKNKNMTMGLKYILLMDYI